LWLGNPLYRELQPDWSIGWVLEDQDHRIVASMGNIPRSFEIDGRRILAATGRGWVAEPEYRSASLLLLEQVINQPHVDLYVNNTVNQVSTAPVSVFQCQRVPVGVWDEYAFWITHYQSYFERWLRQKKYPLSKPLSYPLSAAARIRDRSHKKACDHLDVEIQVCLAFDERFDEFWANLQELRPHVLLAVRTREVLEWHYKYALLEGRVWILAVVDGPRIVAYAVFDTKRYATGLRQARLVDFQSLGSETGLVAALLDRAVHKCREEGVHRLVSIGRWLDDGEWLKSVAPYRSRLPSWLYYYRVNRPHLIEQLRGRQAWDPFLFDGDAGLLR
jgi:hypothetical protein